MILLRIETIKPIAMMDQERAEGMAQRLLFDVLQSIADGHPDSTLLAANVLHLFAIEWRYGSCVQVH